MFDPVRKYTQIISQKIKYNNYENIQSYDVCIPSCIFLHLCQCFLVNFISFNCYSSQRKHLNNLPIPHCLELWIWRQPAHCCSPPRAWSASSRTCLSPTESREPSRDHYHWCSSVYDKPERNKVEDNSDDEDNNKGQPGKEGNTEVKNILDTLQHMS